jgi:hypothetical protein
MADEMKLSDVKAAIDDVFAQQETQAVTADIVQAEAKEAEVMGEALQCNACTQKYGFRVPVHAYVARERQEPPKVTMAITPEKLAEFVRSTKIKGINGEFVAEVITHRKDYPELAREVIPQVTRACYEEFGMLVTW